MNLQAQHNLSREIENILARLRQEEKERDEILKKKNKPKAEHEKFKKEVDEVKNNDGKLQEIKEKP